MKSNIKKSFAVSEKPIKRKNTYNPLSAHWTLYNSENLASDIGISPKVADNVLTKNGFKKAVRIREELIKWKTRMINESHNLNNEIQELQQLVYKLKIRKKQVDENLTNVRNILRIKRNEKS